MNGNLIKQFVPYNISIQLNKLNFNENCLGYWDILLEKLFIEDIKSNTSIENLEHFVLAPIWQQAYEFLLKKVNKFVTGIEYLLCDDGFDLVLIERDYTRDIKDKGIATGKEECIQELINLLSNHNNSKTY